MKVLGLAVALMWGVWGMGVFLGLVGKNRKVAMWIGAVTGIVLGIVTFFVLMALKGY